MSSDVCADGETECPLCLLPLESYDSCHPIQCQSRHCHFNCCMDCLERMIKATKDDKTEASDGNVFRVFLHCPNCRSNLGPSIRDTVLLRKVDKYQAFNNASTAQGAKVVDERLSASELRFKYALEKDETVATAVEAARHREDEFFGRGIEVDTASFDNLSISRPRSTSGSVWSFDDEEGFEADLSGPHKSFIFRHHSQMTNNMAHADEPKTMEDIEPDPTLLCGLDAFMTNQEKQFITSQLISGDISKLAVATEMMHYISALSREGIKPNLKREKSSLALTKCPSMKRSMLESIKEVIREGKEVRRLEEERESRNTIGASTAQMTAAVAKAHAQFGGVAGGRRQQKRLADMEVKRQMEYMVSHPLPLRMPKYAEVTGANSETNKLTFMDDMWDGTVLDAFTKITVNKSLLGAITINKQHAESAGVRRVIDAGKLNHGRSNRKGYIDTERPRVIVASINRAMGQQGIVKGDVVTHFNGEEFVGTASELTKSISGRYEGELLTFVFNADAAVAEALKRRSIISDNY